MATRQDTPIARGGTIARRALLSAAAVATTLTGVAACQPAPAATGHGTPTGASAEITAAIAAYWAGVAAANAPGIEDGQLGLRCDEVEEAAARIAAAPCRSIADLAAKVAFFVAVMNHQNVWQSVTEAEGDVLVSVETAALALAQGRAA